VGEKIEKVYVGSFYRREGSAAAVKLVKDRYKKWFDNRWWLNIETHANKGNGMYGYECTATVLESEFLEWADREI
jgi:hypothetical protein